MSGAAGEIVYAKSPRTPPKGKQAGVRELSKQQSQHKIMLAARQMFAELGYDRSTLRQIAAKAGLTVGALFNHVTDKRDLIYLIFNEEVDTVAEIALAAPRPYQTLRAKILSITEHYFRLFANEPVLSRILLTEVVTGSPGLHLHRYLKVRARLIDGIDELIVQAQQTGEVHSPESSEVIARYIFFTFAASLRWWLASSSRPEWRAGHREYERLLTLQMEGLARTPEAIASSTSPKKISRAKGNGLSDLHG